MKYTQLGRTGLKVSRICLGTMNFGSQTDEKESFRIMDRALELDINFFAHQKIKIPETPCTPQPHLAGHTAPHDELKAYFPYFQGTGDGFPDRQIPDRGITLVQMDIHIDALRRDFIEEQLHTQSPKPSPEK